MVLHLIRPCSTSKGLCNAMLQFCFQTSWMSKLRSGFYSTSYTHMVLTMPGLEMESGVFKDCYALIETLQHQRDYSRFEGTLM